jgi:hypothetical protein
MIKKAKRVAVEYTVSCNCTISFADFSLTMASPQRGLNLSKLLEFLMQDVG